MVTFFIPHIAAADITTGLIYHWKMDENPASNTTTLVDSTATINATLTTDNGATNKSTTGSVDTAISFDGTGDYATVANLNVGTNIITLAFWMNWTTFAEDDDLAFELSANYNSTDHTIIVDPNNTSGGGGNFNYGIHGTGLGYRVERFARPSAGAWHHYVLVFDNSTNTGDVKAYVDGSAIVENVQDSNKTASANFVTANFYMMSRAGSALIAAGSLDDVRIYNRELSSGDAAELYAFGQATVEQEGFRFRNDDGSEAAATWLAAQDTSITRAAQTNTRLRFLLNTDGDMATTQYKLEYKLSTDSTWLALGDGGPGTTPLIEAGDATGTSDDTAGITFNCVYPATVTAGDLIIFAVGKDDDPAITDNTGGLTEINKGNGGATTNGPYLFVGYKIAAGNEDGTNHQFGGDSEEFQCFSIRVPTGEFDASNPIDSFSTVGGSDADQTTAVTPSFSAVKAGGRVVAVGAVDIDPMDATFSPAGWTDIADVDGGNVGAFVAIRDTATTASETVATAAFGINVSDSWAAIAFVVSAPRLPDKMELAASANIGASGANTTVQLAAPAGKATSDFDAGRIQDDENPADTVDVSDDDYTEMEWSIAATADVTDGQIYQFRVTKNGTALNTYTVTPQWTIGDGTDNAVFFSTDF